MCMCMCVCIWVYMSVYLWACISATGYVWESENHWLIVIFLFPASESKVWTRVIRVGDKYPLCHLVCLAMRILAQIKIFNMLHYPLETMRLNMSKLHVFLSIYDLCKYRWMLIKSVEIHFLCIFCIFCVFWHYGGKSIDGKINFSREHFILNMSFRLKKTLGSFPLRFFNK